MKRLEQQHQTSLVSWSKNQPLGRYFPEFGNTRLFDYLFAVPNGGFRNKREAARMKAEGVKAGVSDLFLSLPAHGLHGLYIEMKAPKPHGKAPTKLQRDWLTRMSTVNYATAVCYGWDEAKTVILAYLQGQFEKVAK
ncbi:VRR-NUC domain-containing protein [Paraferrimonas sedimenticola]|uniref:VRR-NUC domain-containing protein n=1 Tax=Paraferrimonas sedimenticola TaxID=375674 RepID=A0AA37RU88_9GAMM|nr:VRR-NUC domain-containing protein [Paraferrimonas sedimenticola]GLP95314.1 hypothetical protein GCM10007895_06200 [Paraferrimonas sedimenticola]